MTILKNTKRISCLFLLGLIISCTPTPLERTVTVKNGLDKGRQDETVTVPLDGLKMEGGGLRDLLVQDTETGEYAFTQLTDTDGDGTTDALIFKSHVPALSEKKYRLVAASQVEVKPHPTITTYSRFVPERIDDYTWENDRVAFRTYGPEAKRLFKEGKRGGTLSSGIDCWLKRVDYPIIDKWYKLDKEGKSYHTDHGEGLDNYHVGSSRGCGGIGIRKDETLYVSDNFIKYNRLETGPLRTSFELDYAPWKAGEMLVKEKKRISLDLGNNLSKIEVYFEPPYPEEIVAGLAIPEQEDGLVNADEEAGWFSFWGKHEDSELGIGIVAAPEYLNGYTGYRVAEKEKSHLFVHLKPVDGKIIYYTGFGWKKSGLFENQQQWDEYLACFAAGVASPLQVSVQK
ncbi:MAG: DUF4861 family protein [Prolixibacteraceae bacterium]|jgi:hypothetical protein|nr:DUF4861 family protein [Prolixibacteraceae bacterium]